METQRTLHERKYEAAFEASPVGIVIIAPDGTLLKVNRAACDTLGYSKAEMQGTSFLDFTHPEDRWESREAYRSLWNGEHPSFQLEKRYLHKGGKTLWGRMSVSAVRGADGDISFAIAHVQDVTEAKRMEEALRESEWKHRAMIENAHDAIFVVQDGMLRFHNPRTEKITGYTAQELTGRPFADYLYPEDVPAAVERHKRRLRGEVLPPNITLRARTKAGSTIWLDITAVPFAWGDRPAVLCLARDITERKALEARIRQAQKMEAISALTHGIAHDFNNILAAVTGFAELALLDADGNASLKKNLEEVLLAGNRAKGLVKQILAFSRQGLGELRPFQVHRIVKEALALARASLPTTIEVCQAIDNKDDLVLCDPAEIHQVLINLFANAGTAMEETGGHLEVSLTEEIVDDKTAAQQPGLRPGPYVKVTVSDTGPGMEPGVRERVFEPFFTTKGPAEGSGMGLSLAHGIVKGHGGEILVRSEPGQGTSVDVFLPKLSREAASESAPGAGGPVPAGKARILFVDDEPALVDLHRQLLERMGHEVVARTSSVEALHAFQARPDEFDLVITDLTMPKLTGVELAGKLQEIRPEIPIILCTGFGQLATAEKVKGASIREILMKPILSRDLGEAIRKALEADDRPKGQGHSSILVVDDEAPVRQMLRQSLEREGYRVRTAEDGKKALQLHHESPADLVITDIFMPEADGLETIRRIREDPAGVKIIAISGGGKAIGVDLLGVSKTLGADRILSKPLVRADLLAAVRDLLAQKEATAV